MCAHKSVHGAVFFLIRTVISFLDENRVEKDRKIQLQHGLSVEIYGFDVAWNADNFIFTRFKSVYRLKQVYFQFNSISLPVLVSLFCWAGICDMSLHYSYYCLDLKCCS